MRVTLVFTMLVALAGIARADRVDRLIRILQTDPSYKVRLQVAIALGKLKDKRAVGPLIRTLRDANETVQGVAAAALGQIGDPRCVSSLKALIARTSNSFVKNQAQKALKRLGKADSGGGKPRIYLTIGKLTNSSGKGGKQLATVFGAALRKEFGGVSGVTTQWGSGKPTAGALRNKRMKGFVVDGAIVSIKHTARGGNVEVWCDVKVSLSTFPQNSMKAFYSGGAGMAVSARGFDANQQQSLHKEIVQAIATEARRRIVASYLANQ